MSIVVGVKKSDLTDTLQVEGSQRPDTYVRQIAECLLHRLRHNDLIGRPYGLRAGRRVDIGAVPALLKILRRTHVNADPELQPTLCGHNGFGSEAQLNFFAAQQRTARIFESKKERV